MKKRDSDVRVLRQVMEVKSTHYRRELSVKRKQARQIDHSGAGPAQLQVRNSILKREKQKQREAGGRTASSVPQTLQQPSWLCTVRFQLSSVGSFSGSCLTWKSTTCIHILRLFPSSHRQDVPFYPVPIHEVFVFLVCRDYLIMCLLSSLSCIERAL